MKTPSLHLSLASFAALAMASMGADAPKDLEEVQNLTLPELRSVTSVAISGDGKFLYAAAFNAGTVTTFTRDVQTGLLEFDDVIIGSRERLTGSR
jgi:6-phosphogluconolactonase (cycloisomerase 2 family)